MQRLYILIFFSVYLISSCNSDKSGEVRIVNDSDSMIVLRHADPAAYQTKNIGPSEILDRVANGQHCIEYYKDYTFSVLNGETIKKDWRLATNWSEYTENTGTKDECTICEFRIENEDL